jgi:hypothetical protein
MGKSSQEEGRLRATRHPLGITLTIVMLVITLLLVIVSVVVQQGLGSLHQARLASASKQALFAAEAGAADAVRRLIEDPSWPGPLDDTSMSGGAVYSVLVLNNLSGASELLAPNGARVPIGYAYLYATGRPMPEGVTRHVGVLLRPGSASALKFALGVGGNLSMTGSKDVFGSVKANGNISLTGNTEIIPQGGNGRLLSSASILTSGVVRMDEAQDVRARGSVAEGAFRGPYLIEPNDTSESSRPFINDGRTSNALNAGESGQVLPNPLPDELLPPDPAGVLAADPVLVTIHSETNPGDPFDTAGGVHYFENGFAGPRQVTGGGTIVVKDGNTISFSGNSDVEANLVSLTDLSSSGSTLISFSGNSDVKGLIYSHDGVSVSGSFRLDGLLICYLGNLDTSGNTSIRLDSTVLAKVPGFTPWLSGCGGEGGTPGGQGTLSILSWERQ